MRKGGDVLSKWVGEAERQLRALFDEAAKRAPSIIFFDEIDGLAPVRSSKQDQVHSSIVSTLLALMDGEKIAFGSFRVFFILFVFSFRFFSSFLRSPNRKLPNFTLSPPSFSSSLLESIHQTNK